MVRSSFASAGVYAHLDSLAVTEGQIVKTGDVLGTRGTTGWPERIL
jgi:murein DD-endopeptidase MepM/ murein hydrolase activator NlpD